MIEIKRSNETTRYQYQRPHKWLFGLLILLLSIFLVIFLVIFPPLAFLFGIFLLITVGYFNAAFYFIEYDNEKITEGNLFGKKDLIHWAKIVQIKRINYKYLGLLDGGRKVKVKLLGKTDFEPVFDILYNRKSELFEIGYQKWIIDRPWFGRTVLFSILIFYLGAVGGTDPGNLFFLFFTSILSIALIIFHQRVYFSKGGFRLFNGWKSRSIPKKNIIGLEFNADLKRKLAVDYKRDGQRQEQSIIQSYQTLEFTNYFIRRWWEKSREISIRKTLGSISGISSGNLIRNETEIGNYRVYKDMDQSGEQLKLDIVYWEAEEPTDKYLWEFKISQDSSPAAYTFRNVRLVDFPGAALENPVDFLIIRRQVENVIDHIYSKDASLKKLLPDGLVKLD